jgi:hypothetical protein
MTVPLNRIGPYVQEDPRDARFASLNRMVQQIHIDILKRLDVVEHQTACANCADGYCYDCILLEMTDAEYATDSALLRLRFRNTQCCPQKE